MKHNPLRAYLQLVSEGVSHVVECCSRHVGHYPEMEGPDVVSLLVSELMSCQWVIRTQSHNLEIWAGNLTVELCITVIVPLSLIFTVLIIPLILNCLPLLLPLQVENKLFVFAWIV